MTQIFHSVLERDKHFTMVIVWALSFTEALIIRPLMLSSLLLCQVAICCVPPHSLLNVSQ